MQKTRSPGVKLKEMRFNVRVNAEQKAVMTRGARLRGTTVSSFIIDHALQAAARLLAEETHVQMAPAQFKHFCRMLDAPPAKNLKAMHKLLNEPSVLDG